MLWFVVYLPVFYVLASLNIVNSMHPFLRPSHSTSALRTSQLSDLVLQVTDNADLIFLRDGLSLILPKLAKVIYNLSEFGKKFRDLPTLAFTHYQAAQPISMGRRAAQWAQDLVTDIEDIEYAQSTLKFRGAQGTTGTQASFVEIFHGDTAKIDRLNEILCQKAGFKSCYDISTQTYSRKVDLRIANVLSSFASSAIHIGQVRHTLVGIFMTC